MEHQTPDSEVETLRALEPRFLAALRHKERGDIDSAEDEFRAILSVEPRLPEPRMELARVLLDTARLEEAEEHSRQALELLESGGQWTADLPESTVRAVAHALLAEILRQRADADDIIFGDPAAFHAIVNEAKTHFERASELDPNDELASYYAFFMGVEGVELPGGDVS